MQQVTSNAEVSGQVAGFQPDLILIDMQALGLNGYEVAQRLPSLTPHGGVPVGPCVPTGTALRRRLLAAAPLGPPPPGPKTMP